LDISRICCFMRAVFLLLAMLNLDTAILSTALVF
jgi:hypothetical protein